jgi:hypothetical protein
MVMVGDPQQLPPTVLSIYARPMMERSMFGRLQEAGCPANVLNVQHRMHPQISQHVASYFYEVWLEPCTFLSSCCGFVENGFVLVYCQHLAGGCKTSSDGRCTVSSSSPLI